MSDEQNDQETQTPEWTGLAELELRIQGLEEAAREHEAEARRLEARRIESSTRALECTRVAAEMRAILDASAPAAEVEPEKSPAEQDLEASQRL